jgi:hypothetical protein
MMQPIHKGAPIAAIAPKKISIPGMRSPSGRVPLGTRVSLGRRNKQIAIKPKMAKGTAANVIFVHEVERGSRFANMYEPHPTMVAIRVHMTIISLMPSECILLSNGASIANVCFG